MKKLSKQIMALCSVFGFASGVMAEDCKPAPDCTALGFTQNAADCSGDALKCPWDLTKAACKAGEEEEGIKPVPCAVGSILGNDQLCYEDKLPDGVKPVGIVFDTTKQLAIALTNIKADGSPGYEQMPWNNTTCDIINLENCKDNMNVHTCAIEGWDNTNDMVGSSCEANEIYNAVRSYGSMLGSNGTCNKIFCMDWFLPSVSEMLTIAKNSAIIQQGILKAGGQPMMMTMHWSSNEYSADEAWATGIVKLGGSDGIAVPKTTKYHVRPVLIYSSCGVMNCLYCSSKHGTCDQCVKGYSLNADKTACTIK